MGVWRLDKAANSKNRPKSMHDHPSIHALVSHGLPHGARCAENDKAGQSRNAGIFGGKSRAKLKRPETRKALSSMRSSSANISSAKFTLKAGLKMFSNEKRCEANGLRFVGRNAQGCLRLKSHVPRDGWNDGCLQKRIDQQSGHRFITYLPLGL